MGLRRTVRRVSGWSVLRLLARGADRAAEALHVEGARLEAALDRLTAEVARQADLLEIVHGVKHPPAAFPSLQDEVQAAGHAGVWTDRRPEEAGSVEYVDERIQHKLIELEQNLTALLGRVPSETELERAYRAEGD